MLRTENILLR
jgi:ubiquitin carboxyl-terminal hydrolase 9/24